MKELRDMMNQWLKENPNEVGDAREATGLYAREKNGMWTDGLATDDRVEYNRRYYAKTKHLYRKGGKYWSYVGVNDNVIS